MRGTRVGVFGGMKLEKMGGVTQSEKHFEHGRGRERAAASARQSRLPRDGHFLSWILELSFLPLLENLNFFQLCSRCRLSLLQCARATVPAVNMWFLECEGDLLESKFKPGKRSIP